MLTLSMQVDIMHDMLQMHLLQSYFEMSSIHIDSSDD